MRRDIEMALEQLEGFENPSAEREQYETPAPLASSIVHLAWSHDDLGRVLDLGCGTGVLGIGTAVASDEAEVIGVDTDGGALRTARRNAARLGVSDRVDFVRGDVGRAPFADGWFDTVIMNPPFGAQSRGADRPFLRAAESLADTVYTVHNEGSLDFVEGFVGGEVTHAFEARITLPRRFEFHDDDEREIRVEVYRLES